MMGITSSTYEQGVVTTTPQTAVFEVSFLSAFSLTHTGHLIVSYCPEFDLISTLEQLSLSYTARPNWLNWQPPSLLSGSTTLTIDCDPGGMRNLS